jgi:ethanolamine ammonia-lyase large subunit
MIIQIRGTSGSGKTHVMNSIRKQLEPFLVEEVKTEGRKRPLLYYYNVNGRDVLILGHYETPCGGCDSIGSAPKIYELMVECYTHYIVGGVKPIILAEGLLLSEDVKWTKQIPAWDDVVVYYLTTPSERCLEQVQSRRELVGNDKPLNPDNTLKRVGVIERSRIKLTDEGIKCVRCSSNQAAKLIIERVLNANKSD